MKKKLVLIFLLVTIDQIIKYLVITNMQLGQSIEIVENVFSLSYYLNDGAAWSILSGKMFLFYVLTTISVIGISYYMYKHPKLEKYQQVGMLLYISGALGNLIDRVRIQAVVDYLDFKIPIIDYDFPIFNLADSLLVCGVILIALGVFKEEKNDRKLQTSV